MDDINELRQCGACSSDYGVTGSRIPVVLPCFHTLCKQCIASRLALPPGPGAIVCHVCNVSHTVGERTFRPNTYVLNYIKNSNSAKDPVEKCKDHPEAVGLFFCETCKGSVCAGCSIKNHKGHDLSLISDKKMEKISVLHKKIEESRSRLKKEGDKIRNAKEKAYVENTKLLTSLRSEKEKVIKTISDKYEEQIGKVVRSRTRLKKEIDEELDQFDKSLGILTSLTSLTNESLTMHQLSKRLSLIKRFDASISANSTKMTISEFTRHNGDSFMKSTQALCGEVKVTAKERRIVSTLQNHVQGINIEFTVVETVKYSTHSTPSPLSTERIVTR